jgi:SAM-dependent methyltransferase
MLKDVLTYLLTRGMQIDNSHSPVLHPSIIRQKSFLRRIYEEWYSTITEHLPQNESPVLELGSGGGFLVDFVPKLITSEILFCRHVEVVLDGSHLPFVNDCLGGIVMTDVLHHLFHPQQFFAEARRCVRAGGTIIMIEPWVTPWSRLVYSKLHHEPFLPEAPEWSSPVRSPLSGANSALPWIIFERDRAQFERDFPEWQICTIKPFMPFRYLLAGGVSIRGFMPGWSFALWRNLEKLLQPWMKDLAMFALIVLVRESITETHREQVWKTNQTTTTRTVG